MTASTTTANTAIHEPSRRPGFFSRLASTILMNRERSAMSQIARFDPALAQEIREAKAKPRSFAARESR